MRLLGILLIAAPLALLESQAAAENWVKVIPHADFEDYAVDKDSIRRGSDGLVYYTSNGGGKEEAAADCKERVKYTLKLYDMRDQPMEFSDWRQRGRPVVADSVGEAIFNYACANA